ncbi:UNVERIFIED_CONTAM: hypothetical protein BEN50_00940 [Euhalothece sp. KZN 001]
MLQRYSHFLLVGIALITATIIGFNLPSSADESNQEYFFKPVPRTNLVVVEPNYGHLYHDGETEAEATRHLYESLGELQDNYSIRQTRLIEFERKGKMIPNLYVYVDAPDAKEVLANKSLEKSST